MNVALHTSALSATADEAIFLPWLKSVAAQAAQRREPTAVLLPLRADAYALKARALSAGLGLFGIHFLTPGELRDRLAQHLGQELRVPLREHLRLLLATAAERVNERRDDEATASVAASPDQLLKAIDLIGAGGWSFSEAGPARLRPVVAEFQLLLKASGFDLVHEIDRVLLKAAADAKPLFANLFITHFNALHWPHWPLLEAAVRLSDQATVCLTHPRFEAEALDAAWIGTWEQTFGSSVEIPADAEIKNTPCEFLVGENTSEQARAIATKALQYLAEANCERLGVLFPAAGALARRVAALLAQLDVPHHDGLAHLAPGPLEDAAWSAWLALQENPRLPTLLDFLRAQPEQPFGGLAFSDVEDALTRTYQELLFDDLPTLGTYLVRHPRRSTDETLADALLKLPLFPAKASLGEFIRLTDELLRGLGWSVRADELRRLTDDWQDSLKLGISRRSWLRWLDETLVSWRVTRAAASRHPYSRLHLLPYAQAESQSWTHLILAGLNEGHWPPPLEDAGYLGEEEIDALNRRLAALNTRVTAQGVQGEGHIAVQPGKAFCLGVAERRALARRQFLNTIESATAAVTATASLVDEATPDRPLNPSEFFNHLHFETHQRAASQDTLVAFRTETARWLQGSRLWPAPTPDLAPARQTRLAYDARRSPGVAFGEYEFSMRTPPPAPLHLSATQWENALKSPALVWMNVLLGIGPGETSDETPWSLTTGQWAHHWLAAISSAAKRGDFTPLLTPEEIRERVRTRARSFRERVAGILTEQRRDLPDWWQSAWEQAWRLTAQFVERVATVRDHALVATERTLPDTAITLPGDQKLYLRGRTDLLLANTTLSTEATPETVWVIDYKTGKKSPLATKRIAAGDGLQLALYALAWRELGAKNIGASILTPTLELSGPQVSWSDLTGLTNLWNGLHAMQEQAVFGQLGPLRDEWSFGGEYPLATLAIDPELLDEKWALTHTAFVSTDEEESA